MASSRVAYVVTASLLRCTRNGAPEWWHLRVPTPCMSRFTFLCVSCSLLLLTACSGAKPVATEQGAQAATQSSAGSPLPEGTFQLNDKLAPSGTAYVRGYAVTQDMREPFCERDCQTYKYVFLVVTDTSNEAFKRFLRDNAGNTYAGPEKIGLGCIKDETLTYWNDTDSHGRQEYRVDPAVSRSILQSSQDAPVTLALTKEPFRGGAGAPACYAHFTRVEIFTASSAQSSALPHASGDTVTQKACRPSGCNAHLCTDKDVMSTCDMKPEYACYKTATCERQPNGQCGWTMTEQLVSCLQNPPPIP